ncbi:MAG: 3-phosphoshikimate 1-carboxyvinyltransferase [Polyangiaceae bacterium]|nr:3-phosphoshikimate 1-carboxyvinyltransferase [Polyangiaceae bacterium]
MSSFAVRPARRPLTGSVPVPSDKSISHRALIFASLAATPSELRGFSRGGDNVSTLEAFRALGVRFHDLGPEAVRVEPCGLGGLAAPSHDLDCGNSGTTMRLLSGVLAGQRFASRLVGDASLSRRPMRRIVEPLTARGARLRGAAHPTRAGDVTPPLAVEGLAPGSRLREASIELAVASAQVKSCLLLSGLFAEGPTTVTEPLLSRDHTERMMDALGLPIRAVGTVVRLEPLASGAELPGFEIDLPGDPSAAAFLLVGAAVVPGSHVTARRCGLNPTRTGILDVLRAAGARTGITPHGDSLGEPVGEVSAWHGELRGTSIAGELALRAIDEIPIACVLAARARGVTELADLAELRVKESDRLAEMAGVLRAFGVEVEERPDGLRIEGVPDAPLRAARVESHGDHRVAMSAAVLALCAQGESVIEDVDCVATSFPRFAGTLRALGAEVEVRP